MAADKVTVERDTEEWLRLSVSLEKYFEQNKDLITIENELFYLLKYPYSDDHQTELVKEYAKSLNIWSQRAFKQGLRDYSDDLKLYQSLCKKIYLDQELFILFLAILKERSEKESITDETFVIDSINTVYGIDLGTTNSCIAMVDETGKAIVKPNMEGMNTTPSVVSYEEGSNNPFVGEVAKEALISDPLRTVAFIKREIGNDAYSCRCEIADSPVKVSAYILKKLVDDVNQLEGKDNKNVVITCPAYFGTKEREQTKQAGVIAGLNVLSIINEPTAAALAYGIGLKDKKNILVYDLGGGTFDVSILSVTNDEMTVVATGGEHRLGGVDWDMLLAKYIAKEAEIELDFESNLFDKECLMLKNLLLINAEKCKKALSVRDTFVVNIPYKGVTKRITISAGLFDQLTSVLLDQTIDRMKEVIDIAESKGVTRIDEYLLVGGSTRMPQVKKRIDREFNCVTKIADPDMAVAKGAALFGDSLINKDRTRPEIHDTSSNSYGIGCFNEAGKYIVRNLIKAQTEVVGSSQMRFRTMYDDQKDLLVEVYEGNSMEDENDILDSTLLDKVNIDLMKPYPKDFPFDLEFKRTSEGLLEIYVKLDEKQWAAQINLSGIFDEQDLDKQKKEVEEITVG